MRGTNLIEIEKEALKKNIKKVMKLLNPKVKELIIADIRMESSYGKIRFSLGKKREKKFIKSVVDFLNGNKEKLGIDNVEIDSTPKYNGIPFIFFKVGEAIIEAPINFNIGSNGQDDEGYHNALEYSLWINDYVATKVK